MRCIFYRREDASAAKGSEREHYQLIISCAGMLDDAVDCGDDGHGADGVHKSVEDNIIVDAVLRYLFRGNTSAVSKSSKIDRPRRPAAQSAHHATAAPLLRAYVDRGLGAVPARCR